MPGERWLMNDQGKSMGRAPPKLELSILGRSSPARYHGYRATVTGTRLFAGVLLRIDTTQR
jgi:hypothetical protein